MEELGALHDMLHESPRKEYLTQDIIIGAQEDFVTVSVADEVRF